METVLAKRWIRGLAARCGAHDGVLGGRSIRLAVLGVAVLLAISSAG
jgi:hypothetical protein